MKRITGIIAAGTIAISGAFLATTPAYASTCTQNYPTGTVSPYGAFNECGPYVSGAYTVDQDVWNPGAYADGATQNMTASSEDSWNVVDNVPPIVHTDPTYNEVVSYPNSQEVIDGYPLEYYTTVTQHYAYTPPYCGVNDSWEFAADDWMTAGPGQTGAVEIMVWTYNCNQTPAGTEQMSGGNPATLTFSGHTYNYWVSPGGPISLVATSNSNSGTIPTLAILNYFDDYDGLYGNLDPIYELSQGAEIVKTITNAGGPQTETFAWTDTDNSISSNIGG